MTNPEVKPAPAKKPDTAAVFNFDTAPPEVAHWNIDELKIAVTRVSGAVQLDKGGLTPRQAKRVHNALWDEALGGRWETLIGQPKLRVATREQLVKVYTLASNLSGPQREAFLSYLEARHKALRG